MWSSYRYSDQTNVMYCNFRRMYKIKKWPQQHEMFPVPKFFRGFPFKPELLLLLSTSLKWLQKSDISFLIYACQRLIYMVIINGVSTPVEFQLTPLLPSTQVTQPMMQRWPNPMEFFYPNFMYIPKMSAKSSSTVPPKHDSGGIFHLYF